MTDIRTDEIIKDDKPLDPFASILSPIDPLSNADNVEPETPPAPPEKPEDTVKPMFDDLSKQLEELAARIPEPAKPEAPDITKFMPDEWEPSNWKEFLGKTREAIKSEIEQTHKAREEDQRLQEEIVATQRQAAEKALDDQISGLEQSGLLPRIVDAKNPEDAGRKARAELYAMGIRYNSTDLPALASLAKEMKDKNLRYDIAKGNWVDATKVYPPHPGANAPVSGRSTAGETREKPTYKDIHRMSMDELVRRFS